MSSSDSQAPNSHPHDPNMETNTQTPPKMLSSSTLLDGQKEILISHGTEVYRLRLTKSGKLILQK